MKSVKERTSEEVFTIDKLTKDLVRPLRNDDVRATHGLLHARADPGGDQKADLLALLGAPRPEGVLLDLPEGPVLRLILRDRLHRAAARYPRIHRLPGPAVPPTVDVCEDQVICVDTLRPDLCPGAGPAHPIRTHVGAPLEGHAAELGSDRPAADVRTAPMHPGHLG